MFLFPFSWLQNSNRNVSTQDNSWATNVLTWFEPRQNINNLKDLISKSNKIKNGKHSKSLS